MERDRFSFEDYKKALLKAKRLGYKFPPLSEFKNWIEKYPKFLLLRHDVDMSPLNALKMAEFEYLLGIKAAYFVLIHSIFYNPLAQPFLGAFKKIADMGHEIGMHYDCGFYEENGININKGIRSDVKALEAMLGIKVKSVAQHKPAIRMKFHKPPSLYINAYDEKLFKKAAYVSESGFKWRGRTLYEFIGSCPKIYALIHPDTWAHPDSDMADSYKMSSKTLQDLIKEECDSFIDSTNDYLKKREAKEIV